MRRIIPILTLLTVCCLTACKNDATNAGSSLLDDEDVIVVKADTFSLQSNTIECLHIISSPDSFMVGEIETDYGTMRAEVLTQVACPEGFQFPSNAVVDSVCLLFCYQTWTGDKESPLAVNVYEIDRKALEYAPKDPYFTDIDLSEYCSFEDSTLLLRNQRIVVAGQKQDSVYSSTTSSYLPLVRCRLNDDFAQRFGQIRDFSSQEAYSQLFKGICITPTFGSSSVLNLLDISMGIYYHFSYRKLNADKDTTVNDVVGFYANSEVRQLNRFDYQNQEQIVEEMEKDTAYNYIVAPAGVYTRLSLPIEQMANEIHESLLFNGMKKRPYVNQAMLRVNVLNVYDGTEADKTRNEWLQPASYMLLVRENSQERFFQKHELPSDTVAILSALTSGTDDDGNTVYYYSYDLSTLLTNQLRDTTDTLSETLDMVLVPVAVETSSSSSSSSSSSITSVKQAQTISATQIESARHAESPLSLKVVYSGFGR